MEKPKRLSTRTSLYWGEIVSQQLNFDRDNVEVEKIRELTKEDILGFYREHIRAGAKNRKKLVCHVVSLAEGGAGNKAESEEKTKEEATSNDEKETEEEATVVKRPADFRPYLSLYPRPRPFVEMSSLAKKRARKDDA